MSENRFGNLVRQVVQDSRLVLFVGDARFPSISVPPPLLRELRDSAAQQAEDTGSSVNQDLMVVLNKSDLVPRAVRNRWEEWFRKTYSTPCFGLSAKSRLNTLQLAKQVKKRMSGKSGAERGVVGVVGLPNTGKSSLINVLHGSRACQPSPRPGHTTQVAKVKSKQGRFDLCDTPGLTEAFGLSDVDSLLLSCTRPEDLDAPFESGMALAARLDELSETWHEVLPCSYESPEQLMQYYADKHSRMLKGGILDTDSGCRVFLRNYSDGKIPVWETPPEL